MNEGAALAAIPAGGDDPAHLPRRAITVGGEGKRRSLAGALDIGTLTEARRALGQGAKPETLDLAGLERLDTPGALFLREWRERGVTLAGLPAGHQPLLDLVGGLVLEPLPPVVDVPAWRLAVIAIGKGAHDARHEAWDLVAFIGRAAIATAGALAHPRRLRFGAITRHVAETGIQALPIVGLMAVMIAVVLGYQGVAQLRPFGGEDYTINLVAVSVVREMGVLITAILVAGRSGSAFAAEIGVMRVREEVDALEVMGIDPLQVLVVPRVVALVVTLPLLAFFADVMGLIGGAAISQVLLGVSPTQYFHRLPSLVDFSDFLVGLAKAPVFAFFIAAVGCMHGLRVSGSADSVGRETTRAVVKSIFLVIVLDAAFSVLFERLGI